MAVFAGCSDARNSRMGKALSILLAGSLSLSFLNVAQAAPALADEGDGNVEGTQEPDTTVIPTQDSLHHELVNTYQFQVNINGNPYPMEAVTQILRDGESIVMPKEPVVSGMRFTEWTIDADSALCLNGTEGNYTAKVNDELNNRFAVFTANYVRLNTLTFTDESGNVVATKLATDRALAPNDLQAANEAYEPTADRVLYGWSIDGGVRIVNWEDSDEIDTDYILTPVTVNANWVTYDAGNGSYVPSTKLSFDGRVTLPNVEPTREGHTFVGWFDSEGNKAENGKTISGTELVARWEVGASTDSGTTVVTEDENSDEVKQVVDATVRNEDGTVNTMLMADRAGVMGRVFDDDFLGWYYKDGIDYRPFNTGDKPSEGFELIARWRPAPVTVTYSENGVETTDGFSYNPNADAFVGGPQGYTYVSNERFNHWTNAEGQEIEANQIKPVAELGTLTAEHDTYANVATRTITYVLDNDPSYDVDGVDKPEPVRAVVNYNGQTVIMESAEAVPEGLTIDSWNTEADGTGATIYPNDLWRVKDDITLYAQYKRDASTIKLKNYSVDMNNMPRIEETYTGEEFRVQLENENLLHGEQLVWLETAKDGTTHWTTSDKMFGPQVGDETATMAVRNAAGEIVWSSQLTLHVNPATLIVSPNNIYLGYGSQLPENPVLQVNGFMPEDRDLIEDLFKIYTFRADYDLAGADASNLPVGDYPINVSYTVTPGLEANPALYNYRIDTDSAILRVNPDGESYVSGFVATGFNRGTRIYDGTAATVEAIAAVDGATISYSVNGGAWTSEVPRMIDAGTYTVVAKAEHPNYATAKEATVTYTVEPAPVTINVANAVKNVFAADPAFTGTVTGLIGADNLGVEYYRSNTNGAAGTYRIDARYTENPNYAVTVNPGVLTIRSLPTQAVPPTQDPILPPSTQDPAQPTNPGGPIDPSVQIPDQKPPVQQPELQLPQITIPSNNQGGNGGNSQEPPAQEPQTTEPADNQSSNSGADPLPVTIATTVPDNNQADNSGIYQATPVQQDNNAGATNVIIPTPGDTNTTGNQQGIQSNATGTSANNANNAPAITPADADDNDGIVINDESTPMASNGAPVYSPSTTIDTGVGAPEVIEDDGNPLGAFDEPICWVHWAILLGVMITAGFGIIVVRRRMATAAAVTAMEQQMCGSSASGQPVYAPIPEYRVR